MEKTLDETIQELVNIHGKEAVETSLDGACPPGYIKAPDGTCIKDILQGS